MKASLWKNTGNAHLATHLERFSMLLIIRNKYRVWNKVHFFLSQFLVRNRKDDYIELMKSCIFNFLSSHDPEFSCMFQYQLHCSNFLCTLSFKAVVYWYKMTELPNPCHSFSRGFSLWHERHWQSDRIKLGTNSSFRSVCKYISTWFTGHFCENSPICSQNPEFEFILLYAAKYYLNLFFFLTILWRKLKQI